jgi:hypothetical protein
MSTPYYADEYVTLYHGNSLAIMAELETGKIGGVIADPPYSSGGQFRLRSGERRCEHEVLVALRVVAGFLGRQSRPARLPRMVRLVDG